MSSKSTFNTTATPAVLLPGNKVPPGLLKAFAFATRSDKWLMAFATFLQLCQGATIPLTALIIGAAINDMAGEDVNDRMKTLAWFFALLALVAFVCGGIATLLFEYTADLQVKQMKMTYLRAVLGQDIGYFDFVDTGTLSTDIEQTAYRFRDGVGQKIGQVAQSISSFIGSYIIAFIYHWALTLVMSAILPITGGSMISFSQLLVDWIAQIDLEYQGAGSVAEESLSSIRTVAAFGLEEQCYKRYTTALIPVEKLESKSSFWLAIIYGIAQGAPFVNFAIGMWYGAYLVRDRMIETNGEDLLLGGVIITVLSCIHRASGSVGMMVPGIVALSRAAGSVRSVIELCQRESKISPYDMSGETLSSIEGHIRFKDVRFSYPTRSDRPVYDNLSLNIKAGETVALVGPSGCGKSTVVQLLQRFYDPGSGTIEIDGLPHTKYNLQWLRTRMALVQQEPRLFTDTIEANIRCGCARQVTHEDVIAAAQAANAHNFIMKLPKQYDTNVGQGGSLLSGGQKQRVAIARAILRDPTILILDEATSALDTESEQIVQAALDKLVAMKKRTTIIIAHRLTTIKQASKIVVLDNPDGIGSKVVECGSHDELMAVENGVYRALAEAQQVMTTGNPEEQAALQRQIDIASAVQTYAQEREGMAELVTPEDQQKALIGRLLPTVSKTGSKNFETQPSKLIEDRQKRTAASKHTVRRMFWEICRSHKRLITMGCFGAICTGASFPLVGYLMASFTSAFYIWDPELSDQANSDVLMGSTKDYVIGLFVLGFGVWLTCCLQWWGWGYAPDRLAQANRRNVFRHYMYLHMEFHDNPTYTVGRLSAVLSADCQLIKGLVGWNTSLIVETMSTVVTGVILAFQGHAALASVCFIVYMLTAPAIYCQVQMSVAVRSTLDQAEDENTLTPEFVLNECVFNLKTIAAYGLQQKYLNMYESALDVELKRSRRNAISMSVATAFVGSLLNAGNALTFWYAGKLLADAYRDGTGLNMEKTLQVLFTMIVVGMRVSYLAGFVTDIRKAKGAAVNIHTILDTKPLLDVRDSDGIAQCDIRGELKFEDLHFTYPSRPDNPVLGGVNFEVPERSTAAMVGASGSGKSTVVQLLERFYCLQPSPQLELRVNEANAALALGSDSVRLSKLPTAHDLFSGEVKIDGKAIHEYNLKFLRSQIGLVGQEPVLFETSIKENIKLGYIDKYDDLSDVDVITACKLANAHSFIMEQPNGYETSVGKGGGQMSGGQKQRLAIARALIRDPRILLLDEATSALDPESERIVQRTIDELLRRQDKARTSIMIAHRLATVKDCDKIVVFAPRPQLGAVVVEEGNHQELMNIPDGAYRKLVELSQMVNME